jgi:glycosyltransferase involved in cell wall biosynthesis
MRIGLLDQTTKGWSAGATFTRMMVACVELAKEHGDIEVIFLSRSKENTPPSTFKSIFIGEQPDRTQWTECLKDTALDVVIPVRDHTVFDVDLPFVGWIPDFQHLRLPELFDPAEIRFRDQFFLAIAQKSSLVLLSSESARMDFEEFFPDQAAKARVAHFPSLLWTLDREGDSATVRKYHLPEKFALVANQFWRHKNHHILPAALGLLKRRRIEVNLVVTGLPSDYRDPENKSLSQFFQQSAKEDVRESVHFLGQIPYQDLVAIMRAAALIIQPSFFEGWSTSIEDSKALGRPLVCSDIPVHREQVPDALGFFDPKRPEALADLLAEIYGDLRPGPDLQREEAAFALARTQASDYGCCLVEMAREAMVTARNETLLREHESLRKEHDSLRKEHESLLKEHDSLLKEHNSLLKEHDSLLEEHESHLKESSTRSEEQSVCIKLLEARTSGLRSELTRLRRSNHDLKRQSVVQFVLRNVRVRWRLLRRRMPHLPNARRRT